MEENKVENVINIIKDMNTKDKLRLTICLTTSNWSNILYNKAEIYEKFDIMLKMIDNTIDEMNNSKEMKDKSILLLSENEIKVLECIKKNIIIGAKDIINQTELSDSTVRRILRKFPQDKKIETTDNNEKSPNKKYKLTE